MVVESGWNRYTLCGTNQFAVQFRNNQANCFCSTGGVRYNVNSGCAGTSEIAFSLRAVKNHLIASVSVDGAHDTALDRARSFRVFAMGARQLVVQEAAGDDFVIWSRSLRLR